MIGKIHFHCKISYNNELLPKEYCVDLVFNRLYVPKIELKIFFPFDSVSRELCKRMIRERNLSNYISIIKVLTEGYENIDISQSKILGVFSSPNKNYFTVAISEVKYDQVGYENEETSTKYYFYLSENAKILTPIASTDFYPRGSWIDNTEREHIIFNSFEFLFTNEFYKKSTFNDSEGNLTINYRPFLELICQQKNEEEQVLKIGKIICILASLYHLQVIGFNTLIYNKNKTRRNFLLSDKSKYSLTKIRKSVSSEHRTLKEFIETIQNKTDVQKNIDWWEKNVNKFVAASLLDGESKFITLYNILEQSLTYLKLTGEITKTVNNRFKGLDRNLKEIKEITRDYLEKVKSFIPEKMIEDRKNFEQQNKKISFLKNIITDKKNIVTTKKLQLIFSKLDIEISDLGLKDIQTLVEMRDDIIHSNGIIPKEEVREMNSLLYKIVNLVLLRLLNLNNQLPRNMRR